MYWLVGLRPMLYGVTEFPRRKPHFPLNRFPRAETASLVAEGTGSGLKPTDLIVINRRLKPVATPYFARYYTAPAAHWDEIYRSTCR